ncbi:hypothetical protein AMAG_12412 [Allomyces macrogynus ATCC 38327]|uniref:Uncharacterized protein n=1 Tax=Allomyces macrogynus (strain ATCC 38327) TaxID=578462 RepID=A0A0L0SYT9_ALLM3|nr:hypothetical protein AMAG_12412 [Allomyces macrogynus ATCC 38327]|eukprot:KNE67677.1 hypothetical protein AMAG_12412 [Allomyces macrogynus ATCC 38327]
MIMAPITKAAADSLNLSGNCHHFALVKYAHQDVMSGPWLMDIIRAVRRQRRFSANMVNLVHSVPQVPGTIDLAWHTRHLSLLVYGKQPLVLTG